MGARARGLGQTVRTCGAGFAAHCPIRQPAPAGGGGGDGGAGEGAGAPLAAPTSLGGVRPTWPSLEKGALLTALVSAANTSQSQ
jgi:hypothetical protein